MIQVTQKDLMPGVHLTAVHTEKFKTCLLSATLLTSLRKETASLNALVPFVLRRGTERAPDMEALSAALDELTAAPSSPTSVKKGLFSVLALQAVSWMTPIRRAGRRSWSPPRPCWETCFSTR